jgi:hypothetical protein
MANFVIPDFQPVPFPAPLLLLKILLVVGFFTHVVPMNVSLGGSFVSGLCLLLGKKDSNVHRMGHMLALSLPIFISLAITQGIVPLLFLQLVYGPLYYTSSILMGVPWILLLVLLISGYYACYIYKFKYAKLGKSAGFLILGASLLFALIAFLFSNNMTLMLNPATWQEVVQQGHVGFFLNLMEKSLIPRYLHFLLAAIAITGLAIGGFGLYWHSRQKLYGEWLIKQGSAIYLVITLIQFGVGAWFMFSLPEPVWRNYMGHDKLGTILFGASTGLSVLSMIALAMSWQKGSKLPFQIGMVSGLLVVAAMAWMRHLLRDYMTASFFNPEIVPVKTQWDLLIIFGVSAVGAIIYLSWLVKIVWGAYNPKTPVESAS